MTSKWKFKVIGVGSEGKIGVGRGGSRWVNADYTEVI